MAIGRGFLVSESHITILKKLPAGVRSAVLGAAFARAFEMDDCAAPSDEFGVLAALAEAVAADALDFDERGEELRRKDAARQRVRRGSNGPEAPAGENVTRTRTASSGREKRPSDAENVQWTDENGHVHRTETASSGRNSRPSDAKSVQRRIEENRKEENVCGAHARADESDEFDGGDGDGAPTAERIASWTAVHFSPPPPMEFVEDFRARMAEGGWRDARGRDLLRNCAWRRELSAWWSVERRKESARAASAEPPASTGAGRVEVPMFDGGEAAE